MSFLDACRALIGVDSTPGAGTRQVAEVAGELARRAGLEVELVGDPRFGPDELNLIARPRATRPPAELLLQTRLDTAPSGPYGRWSKTDSNPFNASIYGDTLYGLGAADAKLDFLCKLEAARGFVGRELRLPFVLVGTFGGQSGMSGALRLVRQKKVNARRALVGEPTGLKLVHAGAGIVTVEIAIPFSSDERRYRREHDGLDSASSQSRVFYGDLAHDALAPLFAHLAQLPNDLALLDLEAGTDPRSAPAQAVLEIDLVAGFREPILPKLVRVHQSLRLLADGMAAYREEDFAPAHPTVHLSLIRTNDVGVTLTGGCRLPPGVTDERYDIWMSELARTCRANGATFSVKDYRPGFKTDPASDFVTGAQDILGQMGLDARLARQAVTSEANVFSRLGIECVAWGPGRGLGNAHRPNEHVALGDLRVAVDFYRRMIEEFCS